MLKTLAALVVALAAGAAATGYEALDPDSLVADAQTVADAATCQTLQTAAAASWAASGTTPETIADLLPYVSAPDGSLTSYAVVDGRVSGPGC